METRKTVAIHIQIHNSNGSVGIVAKKGTENKIVLRKIEATQQVHQIIKDQVNQRKLQRMSQNIPRKLMVWNGCGVINATGGERLQSVDI